MSSSVGLELVIVGALVAILGVAWGVARLRHVHRMPLELPPNDVLETLTSARARLGEDSRDVLEEVARSLAGDPSLSLSGRPAVLMVVGTAGSGRTTMVGKLAHRLVDRGRLVAITAVAPFRLAPVRDLASWAERAGADLIPLDEATDPGVAAYEAVEAAKAHGSDVLIVDAVGGTGAHDRPIDELAKVRRVLEKAAGQVHETLLVLDASAGHDTIIEARPFVDALGVTGIALSNLDRTGELEIVLVVREELGIPLKLAGTGGDIDDLRSFDADWFARILVGSEREARVLLTRESLPAISERPPSAAES
jgi:fused signal recognition particle receptor